MVAEGGGKISVHRFGGGQKRSARLLRGARFECERFSEFHPYLCHQGEFYYIGRVFIVLGGVIGVMFVIVDLFHQFQPVFLAGKLGK